MIESKFAFARLDRIEKSRRVMRATQGRHITARFHDQAPASCSPGSGSSRVGRERQCIGIRGVGLICVFCREFKVLEGELWSWAIL